jgi:hypothetical protein
VNRANGVLGTLAALLAGLVVLTGASAKDEPKGKLDKKDDAPMQSAPAVKPKPLSEAVKKGLAYLIKEQHDDGGWGQGGGWRQSGQGGGRVEGGQVQDPSDVGNTCIALLALIRAGNSPKDGPYAKNVARGVAFVCSRVEKADKDSLYVTDVRNTQLQVKIGPYVDTFLTSMVLAELKGKMPDANTEKRTVAALDKTLGKMKKHQKADGTFAGNTGWATVLSQGLANKGFARAAQAGIALDDKALKRVQDQVAQNFDAKTGEFRGGGVGGAGGLGRGGVSRGGPATATAPSDAGVSIYTASAYLTNSADLINAYRDMEKKAKETLARKDAPKAEREKAEATLKTVAKAEQLRQQTTKAVVAKLGDGRFMRGFGSNGGEEFLSFMNIGEALLLKGGDAWKKWDKSITDVANRAQDKDGSWSGQHCITGKTFCTAAALLVLMVDRTPIPVVMKEKQKK